MIIDIKAREVSIPLQKPLLLATQTITEREYTIVEVTDSDGFGGKAVGYSRGAPVSAVVLRMLRPRWLGSRPEDHTSTYDTAVRANVMQGTHGIFWRALSLLDCAIYDLMCHRARLPLAVLLGAQVRPVPVTLAGCYPTQDETPESIAELMMAMATFKASAIKITGSGDLERDSRRLVDCRRALGEGTPLIIDLYSSASSADELLRYAKGWADLGMAWLEDPFRFDDLTELALLTSELPYPVGVGDEQSGLENFRNLLRFAGVRVVRLDATTCGGVTGFRRISSMATAAGVPVSCHVFHHLHAQLACLTKNITVEYMLPESGVDAIHEILGPDLEWRDGSLVPENSPGICSVWNVDSTT